MIRFWIGGAVVLAEVASASVGWTDDVTAAQTVLNCAATLTSALPWISECGNACFRALTDVR
jgi:hypothetical protein